MSNKLITKPNIFLVVSPNFSMKMLQEEIDNIKNNESDFTKSVDWRVAPPLGILYIAGSLREHGYDVKIYDLHKAFYLCRENGYFKEKDLSDFFKDYFESILRNNAIDVLGISCLFNVASTSVEEMVNICKKVSPETIMILGGHYPTIMYKEILQKGVCDYIILGEAEEEFVWLMDNLNDPLLNTMVYNNSHIVNSKCVFNTNKKPAIIQNLDDLALPAWDLLPNCEEYIENSSQSGRVGSSIGTNNIVKSVNILTTRGCPMKCTFCGSHVVHGRKIRFHSLDYTMKYLDWMIDKYDVNHILVIDDMFIISPKRTIEFCHQLLERYNNRFTIEFPNGLSVWTLNDEVISNLKEIGMKACTIAIESGNQYVQKHILKKNLDLSLVKKNIELLKKHDIEVRVYFILGLIGETLEMIQETIDFAISLNIDWAEFKVFTPLVGSEMYDIAQERGFITGDTSEHVFGRGCIKTPEFTPEQVESLRYDANILVNFINNRNLKEGKFDVAEQVFSKLISLYPNHLFAQWGLWTALKGLGRTDEANIAAKRLTELIEANTRNKILVEKYNIKLDDN